MELYLNVIYQLTTEKKETIDDKHESQSIEGWSCYRFELIFIVQPFEKYDCGCTMNVKKILEFFLNRLIFLNYFFEV